MAMAIHSAKLISEIILKNFDNREAVEAQYQKAWKNYFGFDYGQEGKSNHCLVIPF
jgi:flavin-dependent dehydrogenase